MGVARGTGEDGGVAIMARKFGLGCQLIDNFHSLKKNHAPVRMDATKLNGHMNESHKLNPALPGRRAAVPPDIRLAPGRGGIGPSTKSSSSTVSFDGPELPLAPLKICSTVRCRQCNQSHAHLHVPSVLAEKTLVAGSSSVSVRRVDCP